MADLLVTRRRWLLGAGALVLAGCDTARPSRGVLGAMERWNGRVQRWLFDPERLAPAPSPDENTAPDDFPVYFVSDSVPIAPAGWRLRVGGSVTRPALLSLDDLQRMPRTELRVRHYCVEGWSAVAPWHGVRLRDLAAAVGAGPRPGYAE